LVGGRRLGPESKKCLLANVCVRVYQSTVQTVCLIFEFFYYRETSDCFIFRFLISLLISHITVLLSLLIYLVSTQYLTLIVVVVNFDFRYSFG